MILLCLLQDDHSTMSASAQSHPDSLDPARRAILEWLVEAASCQRGERRGDQGADDETAMDVGEVDTKQERLQGILDTLWHHSNSKMVSQVSLRYFDFFKVHIKFLAGKTRELERRRLEEEAAHEGVMETEEQGGVGTEGKTGEQGRVGTEGETGEQGVVGGETPNPPPPLREEVEWVSAHWVELARSGEQVRETCISLLKEKSNPFRNHPNELTYSGCCMRLPLPKESIWTVMLDRVLDQSQISLNVEREVVNETLY